MARTVRPRRLELTVCALMLTPGCGGHEAPAPARPSLPASEAPAAGVVMPPPTEAAPPTSPDGPAASPRMLAEGAALAWPTEEAVSLEEVDLPLAVDVWGQVTIDGLPLVALSDERLVVIPADGQAPMRAYANERSRPRSCSRACVAAAGGAFLTLDGDGALVAREVATLATRWERPAPEGATELYGDGDTFVVVAPAGVFGLDAVGGATRWQWEVEGGYPPRVGQGLFVRRSEGVLFALDLGTGEPRFRLETGAVDVGPITPAGFALVRDRYASDGGELTARQVRLVGLDGTDHLVQLDADVESADAVVVAARTLTVLVSPANDRAEARRYDARTGRRLQRSRPFGRAVPGTLVAVGPDVAVVDRTLGIRLLDGETLAERWLGGEGRWCFEPAVWRPSVTSAPVLACRGYAFFALYRASPERDGRRTVTVSGTVRCGGSGTPAHVMVEGVVARADRRGRYRVAVRADDTVNVTVVADTDILDADCSGYHAVALAPDADEASLDFDLEWRNVAEGL